MHDGFGCLISMSHMYADDDDWTVNITLNIAYTLHSSPHPSENAMNQQKRRLFYYFYYLLNGIRMLSLSACRCLLHSLINTFPHQCFASPFYLCWLFTFVVHTLARTQTHTEHKFNYGHCAVSVSSCTGTHTEHIACGNQSKKMHRQWWTIDRCCSIWCVFWCVNGTHHLLCSSIVCADLNIP